MVCLYWTGLYFRDIEKLSQRLEREFEDRSLPDDGDSSSMEARDMPTIEVQYHTDL